MSTAEVDPSPSSSPSPAAKKRKLEEKNGNSSNGSNHHLKEIQQQPKMAGNGNTHTIDEGLYSRQLYVLGHEAMQRMATSDVLISGLGWLVDTRWHRSRATERLGKIFRYTPS